jgi:hypothetical protein
LEPRYGQPQPRLDRMEEEAKRDHAATIERNGPGTTTRRK